MTNEYKQLLGQWLTGNYTTTTPYNEVSQNGTVTLTNIIKQYLATNYTTTNCITLKSVKSLTNPNTLTLLYDRDNERSIMLILNETLQPIQLITTYASGTQFKNIMNINVGEDGEFFLLENIGTAIRFVMCNNITAGDVNGNYEVVLRKAYNVGGNLTNLIQAYDIVKYPNEAKYLVIGTDTDMTPQINIATEIVINVGTANEYNDFTFSSTPAIVYRDLYYTSNGENISFKICGTSGSNYIELVNNGYAISANTYSIPSSIVYNTGAVKINNNDAYILTYNTDGTYSMYHFNGSTISLMETMNYGDSFNSLRAVLMNINRNAEIVYGTVIIDGSTSNTFLPRAFTIADGVFNSNLITDENINTSYLADTNLVITSSKIYDLYNIIYAFGGVTINSYVIYNSSRYNGDKYIAYNSFAPSNIVLNDINNEVLFARGLYNLTIIDENTTAVFNIPNNYANNVEFYSKLYGATEVNLVNDQTAYEKNIYENLLINFNNSINITNDNIYMKTPAIRLNNSISQNFDYNNSKIGYIRLNYQSKIVDVVPTITQTDPLNYEVSVDFFTGEPINSIMILSNDKNTIYDTFVVECELNKVYNITRSVEIS